MNIIFRYPVNVGDMGVQHGISQTVDMMCVIGDDVCDVQRSYNSQLCCYLLCLIWIAEKREGKEIG